MKISTKGRYGLRAMIDLAVYSNAEHVSLACIANRQNLSTTYLEHVFSVLKKSRLLVSVKGAQGGYKLYSAPSEIRIGEVIRVLEGDISIIDYDYKNGELEENVVETTIRKCIRLNIWDKINDFINEYLDSLTLEDLAILYRKLNNIDDYMYYL